MSIHESEKAVTWIEDNWDGSLLTSFRNSGCNGPFAWMLSPTQPAFAIFGSHNESVVVNMAHTLAHSSGFPVVIRSANDNPASTLLYVKSVVHCSILNHSSRADELCPHNTSVDSSGINGSPSRDSGGPNDNTQNINQGASAGEDGGENGTRGEGRDGDEGPNRRVPGIGRNSGGRRDRSTGRNENDRLSFNFSRGDDGGGGGDDGGPTMQDGKWASPLHRTRVELVLKLNAVHTYAVNIGYTFKVMLSRIRIIV
jgi:hypothetical protein